MVPLKLEQYENACCPIPVTDAGIVRFPVNPQPWNAYEPMDKEDDPVARIVNVPVKLP